jgi:hypothetical protein
MDADFADLPAACGPWLGRIRAWGIVLADLLRSARPSMRNPMTTIRQDIRVALRSYRHAPGFATLVVLILTIGIGGVVAMFSVVSGVLLADLPYQGLLMAAVGIGVGLVAAIGAAAAIRSLLTGISPGDPVTFVSTMAILAAVALVASYPPARRAARLDPARTLRGD